MTFCTLAIDPGRVSGWAIFIDGDRVTSGVARNAVDRANAAQFARYFAESRASTLIVVAEKWTPGGKFAGARTMAGLGASWGLWIAAIENAAIPKSRVFRVHTQTWRAGVLGGGRGITREQWDMRAQHLACALAGLDAIDDNEADAICIGAWAYTPKGRIAVDGKLPKRLRLGAATCAGWVAGVALPVCQPKKTPSVTPSRSRRPKRPG